MEAEEPSEGRVLRREAKLVAGAHDGVVRARVDAALRERLGGVGGAGIVEGQEAMEAARSGRGDDAVLALRRPVVALGPLGADGAAPECDDPAPFAAAMADREEGARALSDLDPLDRVARQGRRVGRRRGSLGGGTWGRGGLRARAQGEGEAAEERARDG